MLKQNVIDSTEACTDCFKNSLLIKKYEDLIHLYKKKQVKLSGISSSQISNGPTSSSLDQQSSESPCSLLFDTLFVLYRKRCQRFFKPLFPKSCKKFLLLSISNKMAKSAKKRAFQKLTLNIQGKLDKVVSIMERNRYSILSQGFTIMKTHNGIPVLQQIILETSKPELIDKNIQVYFQSLRHHVFTQDKLPSQLGRKLVELQIMNKNLVLQNQVLRESLLEASRRQTKENQKKKQSLQMLAEEISEKNQQIESLRRTIKAYQQTYKGLNNVLDEDIIELRKDVDRLESVNERLNDDLNKLKQKTQDNNNKLKVLEQNNLVLQKENEQIRKDGLKQQIKWQKAHKVQAEFNNLITVLDKKLKRLNVYEKQLIQNNSKSHNLSTTQTQDFKAEIILLFLANLTIPEYKLHAQNLFDDQQKDFLYQHKKNWFDKTQEPNKQEEIKMQGCDISQIEMKGGNLNSIFEALDSPRERSISSPVMRMLELQIQKNKQISKISQLKQKLLHVRVIILKLLKSLQLQSGIKIEVEGILRVIFDMFEYSEEERESIFVKKRKLFGLI